MASERPRTGLIYDAFMTKHRNEFNPNHPETPERMTEAWSALETKGLKERCLMIDSREATDEEILRVHSEEHLTILSSTPTLPQDALNKLSLAYSSIFFNPYSYHVARLAAGSVTNLVEAVVAGNVQNGMAIVRPPGHHAECSKCMGFSLFNNVSIATKHAIEKLGVKRVLIVDWDIHHGNGTQHQFYDDNRVLYFSLHRYDDGEYFPFSEDADYDKVGSGRGAGYNVNVAWNHEAMGDTEYLQAFYHLLLPVALEFNPELVLVSCGFDAGEGDPLGGYHVTPACYAHMTHLLMGVAQGKMVLAMEGGYNLSCIRESTGAIVSVLLGDYPLPEISIPTVPHRNALNSIRNTGLVLSKYWKSLQVFGGDVMVDRDPLKKALGDTPESGESTATFGREEPTENLSELLSMLTTRSVEKDHGGEPPNSKPDTEADPQKLGSHDQGLSGSHDQETPATPGSCDQGLSGSHDQETPATPGSCDQETPATTGSCDQGASGSEQGQVTMYAVTPKPWCEHLSTHVKPLPPRGIDSAQPCEICGEKQEPWICLTCYHVFCGRYVNQHMLVHEESTGHKIALSLADLSVWCYLCDRYIHNDVKIYSILSLIFKDTFK